MKLTIVIIVCLVLINFISEAYGCRCARHTNQQSFCRSTFVSRGKVTRIKNVKTNQVDYTVAVTHNFKIKVPNTLTVQVPGPSNSCEVSFKKGVEYLMSGTVSGSTYHTSLCRWNQKWQDISSDTRTKLLEGQFNNC